MKKTIALLMTLALLLALTACGAGTQAAPSSAETGTEAAQGSAAAEAAPEPAPEEVAQMPEASAEEPAEEAGPELTPPDPVTLPLTENGEIFSFWVDGAAPFVTMYLGSGESYNTAACTEYLESITGVHIEYKEVSMFSAA